MSRTRRRGAPRVLLACALAASLLALPTQAWAAGKGGGERGGKLTATIAIDASASSLASATAGDAMVGGEVSFAVTRSKLYDNDVVWVSNRCWDDSGTLVEQLDLAVGWDALDSYDGEAGPYVTAGTHCTAFVTLRPWRDQPLGDAVVHYDVAP